MNARSVPSERIKPKPNWMQALVAKEMRKLEKNGKNLNFQRKITKNEFSRNPPSRSFSFIACFSRLGMSFKKIHVSSWDTKIRYY